MTTSAAKHPGTRMSIYAAFPRAPHLGHIVFDHLPDALGFDDDTDHDDTDIDDGMVAPWMAGMPPPQTATTAPAAVPATVAQAIAVMPITPTEQARLNIARMLRGMIGDLPGDCRRLHAYLTAASAHYPELAWVVGGHRAANGEAVMVVSSNVGLGFIPADVQLPHHVLHVFVDTPSFELSWMGAPLRAVLDYGQRTGQPIQHVVEHSDELPQLRPYGGRGRLMVVDPCGAEDAATQPLDALLAGLSSGVQPDELRTWELWSRAVNARQISVAEQVKTWLAFCRDQADGSVWLAAQAEDESAARTYISDYRYYAWNVERLCAATPPPRGAV